MKNIVREAIGRLLWQHRLLKILFHLKKFDDPSLTFYKIFLRVQTTSKQTFKNIRRVKFSIRKKSFKGNRLGLIKCFFKPNYVYLFIHSFVRRFVRSFVRSFIYLFNVFHEFVWKVCNTKKRILIQICPIYNYKSAKNSAKKSAKTRILSLQDDTVFRNMFCVLLFKTLNIIIKTNLPNSFFVHP